MRRLEWYARSFDANWLGTERSGERRGQNRSIIPAFTRAEDAELTSKQESETVGELGGISLAESINRGLDLVLLRLYEQVRCFTLI